MSKGKYVDVEDLFFCYSMRLFLFIRNNSHPRIQYLDKQRNSSTNKFFWTFNRTTELMKLVNEFTKIKNKELKK